MNKIRLTKGAHATVDDSDYEFLNQWNWHLTSNGYAARSIHFTGSDGKKYRSGEKVYILMHRQILGVPDWALTDHADGNKLNNQKNNIRIADKAQNEFNCCKPRNNSTGYKGVFYDPRGKKKFYARCVAYGKSYSSRYFDTQIEAAIAYDQMASKRHGEFAKLNFASI